jgi:hypothetical protein
MARFSDLPGLIAVALTAALWLPPLASAQRPAARTGAHPAAVVAFITALHRAAAAGDAGAFAGLVRFPLTVSAGGVNIPVADAAALQRYYDTVVTESLVAAIARAHAALGGGANVAQDLQLTADDIFIGGHAVHATRIDGVYKVVRLAPPSLERGWRAARPHEQRMYLQRPGPTRASGALARGESESYIVSVLKGQLLTMRLTEVSGDEVVARLVDTASSQPLDARADAGVRAWTGRVRSDGFVRIVVSRRGGTGAALGYLLTVDAR